MMEKMKFQSIPLPPAMSTPPAMSAHDPMNLKKAEQFVPMKVIQKKGVNISKSINKPK